MNENIKVLLIGDFSLRQDEGMKKTTSHLANSIPNYILTSKLDISSFLRLPKQIINALFFQPDIVHYLHGPTLLSIIIIAIIGKILRAKTVISAIHPENSLVNKKLIDCIKPDMLIVYSKASKQEYAHLGKMCVILQNGVDLNRFLPINYAEKEILRKKYGYSKNDFIVFHAGPIVKSRNLFWLTDLNDKNIKVIIAASSSTRTEKTILHHLEKFGIKVFQKYIPRIEELYQISDCYVFPCLEKGSSIDSPLSILEALSCGLPIVTTKFRAIGESFIECPYIIFVNDELEFRRGIYEILENREKMNKDVIRMSIIGYSWENCGIELARIYELLRSMR